MTPKTSTSQTVQNLFSGAAAAGVLGTKAINAINVEDLGAQIQEGLGVAPDDIQASDVTLVGQLIDDSGSIRMAGNAQHVRDGHNLIISALSATKQKEGILAYCRYLDGTVLYPFCKIVDAVKMTNSNYNPNGGTPLYDESLVLLATMAAKCQEFANSGVPARAVAAIISDGADMHSRKKAKDVAAVVNDLLIQETFIIIGMGIWDGKVDANKNPIPGTGTDFKTVFGEMGLQDKWILTPGNSPSEIRKAFAMVSQSSVRASQGAQAFSKAAMGGFGA